MKKEDFVGDAPITDRRISADAGTSWNVQPAYYGHLYTTNHQPKVYLTVNEVNTLRDAMLYNEPLQEVIKKISQYVAITLDFDK